MQVIDMDYLKLHDGKAGKGTCVSCGTKSEDDIGMKRITYVNGKKVCYCTECYRRLRQLL